MTEQEINSLLTEILPVPATEVMTERFVSTSSTSSTDEADVCCGALF